MADAVGVDQGGPGRQVEPGAQAVRADEAAREQGVHQGVPAR